VGGFKLTTSLILVWAIACASLSAQEVEGAVEAEVEAPPAAPTVAMVEPTGDASYYWSRWRGPTGQGIVYGEGYPDHWGTDVNVLWEAEVPGRDNSSAIVWGDKVFVTTTETNGDERPRSVICYRASDGKLLWQTYAPTPEHRVTQRRVSVSIGTPVTDGEAVYAYLGNAGLMAVDFEGNRLWHRNLGSFDHATSSPILYQDTIILLQVSPSRKGSFLMGYSKETGNPLWQNKRKESFACGSPIVIKVGEQDQVVVSGEEYVRAYDPTSGDELWAARGTTDNAIPTPVVGYGMVFTTSGHSGATMAIHPTGSGDVTLSHIAWKQPDTGPLVPSPLFYDGYLYVLNDASGKLTCFDAATGDVVWSEQIADARNEGLSASPVLVEDKLFITDVRGETFVIRAGPKFEFIGRNRLEAKIRSSPALSHGRWYFRSDTKLIAVGLE
jgi:outer membrane protein assembly factor BamB